jgi:hypothetical protein
MVGVRDVLGPSWMGVVHGVGGVVGMSSRFLRQMVSIPSPLRHVQLASLALAGVCILSILTQFNMYLSFATHTFLFSLLAPQLLVPAYTFLLAQVKSPTILGLEDAFSALARSFAPLLVAVIGSYSLSYALAGSLSFVVVALVGI